MIVDSLQDPWAELRALKDRVRHLETASPLENASIERNGIRMVIPGGNDDGDGATKFGHEGGKHGFLIKEGSDWLTAQELMAKKDLAERELTAQKIAESHEYPNARIGALESSMNSFGPTVNSHGTRITNLEGRMGSAEGRLSSVESDVGSKVSQASFNSLNGRVNNTIDRVNEIEKFIDSKYPEKPVNPPLNKG